MAYETYEMALISSFGQDVKNGKVLLENDDLRHNKARSKYTNFITSIGEVKAKEYQTSEFATLGQKEVTELAFAIIVKIFGDKVIDDALEFFSILYPTGQKEALNGISLTVVDTRDGSVMKQVEVPDLETSSNVVTIVHEFAHYYLNKVGADFNKKRYYEEIISLFCEKLSNILVELDTGEKDYAMKMEEHRISVIDWHYHKQMPEVEFLVSQYKMLKQQAARNPIAQIQLASFEKQFPVLKTAEGISALKGYYQNMADSYGMGYLYGESLLARYKDDFRTFHVQLDKLTNGEQSVQGLLNYYGINPRNYEVYNVAKDKIEEVKAFKRR